MQFPELCPKFACCMNYRAVLKPDKLAGSSISNTICVRSGLMLVVSASAKTVLAPFEVRFSNPEEGYLGYTSHLNSLQSTPSGPLLAHDPYD